MKLQRIWLESVNHLDPTIVEAMVLEWPHAVRIIGDIPPELKIRKDAESDRAVIEPAIGDEPSLPNDWLACVLTWTHADQVYTFIGDMVRDDQIGGKLASLRASGELEATYDKVPYGYRLK